jgi:hypothetical protein
MSGNNTIAIWAWVSTNTPNDFPQRTSTTENEVVSVFKKFPMASIKGVAPIKCLEESRREIDITMVGLDKNINHITWKERHPRIIIQHGNEMSETDIKSLDLGLHMSMRSMVAGYTSETPLVRLLKIKEQLSSSEDCPKGYHPFTHLTPPTSQPSHNTDIPRRPGIPGGAWNGFVANANRLNPPISKSWSGDYRTPGGYILAALVSWDQRVLAQRHDAITIFLKAVRAGGYLAEDVARIEAFMEQQRNEERLNKIQQSQSRFE